MSQVITITKNDIFERIKHTLKVPEIIEQIVASHVIADAASKAEIELKTEELQAGADRIRSLYDLESAEDTWQWFKKNSLSLSDFEKIVSTNLLSEKLARHLFEDKVEGYFFQHQLDYAGVIMYEIIFDDEDLAIELFYSVREREISFPEIAHQYIQDSELRRQGGYRGILRRHDLKPEISAAVFAAKPPQILKPIITARGVHLILVEEIILPQLDVALRDRILSQLFADWLQQQVRQYETNLILD